MTIREWFAEALVTEECCNCGVAFAMPLDLEKRLRQTRDTFYCPNGHGQHYVGKTDAQKLKEAQRREEWARQREQAIRDQLQASERSKAALKGVVTRTKRRVANGVCRCRRSFKDLARHMEGQHPDYMSEANHG